MTNTHHMVLYIGFSGDIIKRGWQLKHRLCKGFTKRYNATKMVYVEFFDDVHRAIAREKQLKGWRRAKKESLINKVNPGWRNLYNEIIQ